MGGVENCHIQGIVPTDLSGLLQHQQEGLVPAQFWVSQGQNI